MKLKQGLTLIEVMIAAGVFLLFSIGAYQGYAAVYSAIASARHRALAADLANEQFEIIKNMPYLSVGTIGGDPSGVIADSQYITRDNISFTLSTTVVYIDDPFDGVAGGTDLFSNDYKLVELSIDCQNCKSFDPVVFTGRVAPPDIES